MSLKLDFGCGSKLQHGWTGIDIRPLPGIQYVCDMWEVPLEDGCASQIYCRHSLEHLLPDDAKKTMKTWFRLLESGGSIEVIVPNLTFHAKQLLGQIKSRLVKDRLNKSGLGSEIDHAMAGFYGWQRNGEEWDYHKSGWTGEILADKLGKAGFSFIHRLKNDPWHVHMEATAHK